MRTTCIVADERFQRHDPGYGHPERPERLKVLDELLAEPRFRDLPRVASRAATEIELARVHSSAHLKAVAASAGRPQTRFDADTAACADSFAAAKLAVGSAIEAADAILAGSADNGFAALRPPGHHAEHDRAMGFCLFNNVAVVARHLLAGGLERILILDWDVHHGNGTQHIFYNDTEVMYVSLHQYPFYPGTGSATEVGAGKAEGYSVNLPMSAGAGPADYGAAMREIVMPAALRFDPQFVLVSAGFDAHRDDPLAQINLDADAFAELTDVTVRIADRCAKGRALLLLEGGYDPAALKESVAVVLRHLREPAEPGLQGGELSAWGRQTAAALSSYWKMAPER